MKNIVNVVCVVVLGLAFGSFITAFVWRLHKQAQNKSKAREYSVLTGRSMCPNCGHRLKAADLVPIFSWLMLRGKCRYCAKPISPAYPLVEATTTLLFILSYFYWPFSFSVRGTIYFVIWLILLVNLVALAIYDIHWLILPSKILYPLFGLVGLQIAITLIFFSGSLDYFLSSLLGLAIGGGVFYALFEISGGKWIGGGDVRLGALLGLYLGSGLDAILMIFFASVLGTLYALPQLASGKLSKKTMIPYGPFLILAVIILRLFGGSISSWLRGRGLSF